MEIQDLAAILLSQNAISDPVRYANLFKMTNSPKVEELRSMLDYWKKESEIYDQNSKSVSDFRKNIVGNDFLRRRNDRFKNTFGTLDQQDQNQLPNIDASVILDKHFTTVSNLCNTIVRGIELISSARMTTFDDALKQWVLDPSSSGNPILDKMREAQQDDMKNIAIEQNLNRGASTNFMQGLSLLNKVPTMYTEYLFEQLKNFEIYYERLRTRHSTEGIAICNYVDDKSITLTDIAIMVWENIDRVGETQVSANKDEISSYTINRASTMIQGAKQAEVWSWLIDPGNNLIAWAEHIKPFIDEILKLVIDINQGIGEPIYKLLSVNIDHIFGNFKLMLTGLDVNQIQERHPDRAISKTEQFALNHRNESLQRVADLLITKKNSKTIIENILELKIKERQFFLEENSFYVCRISPGNMFTGEAPGALEVIPGEKPHADLTKIWGEGFDEIRDFIDGMGDARKWQPLFLATSPSKSIDKNNVLLVGPGGVGKTQIMRAVGASNDSISIFALGSDFLTAWKGEDQKNPARLFDAAVKLHKESGRPVFILIDEIDAVLDKSKKASFSSTDLSTEFQSLMDGVVSYKGLSLWGATNHVERISEPMLRRFSKVLIVGELNLEDRVCILRHYIESFLPCENNGFFTEDYETWAEMTDGATGDILRRIVDGIWLSLIRNFINDHNESANEILDFIDDNYGQIFNIEDLTDEDRKEIRYMISQHTQVTADMVTEHINETLNNFAVQKQIKSAKDTYRKARNQLQRQLSGDKGIGF